MTGKEQISTPLLELLEQIKFENTDSGLIYSVKTTKAEQEKVKNQYNNFFEKAINVLKKAAGYTDETN